MFAVMTGCATVGERNEISAAMRAVQDIHTEEARQYSISGHFVAFPVRYVEGYEIVTALKGTGYRVTARSQKRDYPAIYSDETMKVRVVR